ncbi:DUF3592 domain-containing protein [Natronomonas marina]|jgi:hypothetical protein|uniref:DUF3592 domain-containing protein n=1 Tax=Natronomonas marina TaxID=2961939 RepID=UPI0020C982EB|nr:DUF3592 domain-containing protein [Natronomonas marina]
MKRVLGALALIVVSLAAAVALWQLVIAAPSAAAENADTQVEGTVVDTELARGTADCGEARSTTYSPSVTYRYTYEGTTYRSENLYPGPSEGTAYCDRSEAQAVVDRYPEGSTVTVHIDGDRPDRSFLETEPIEWNDYVPVAFPLLFALMGLIGLVKELTGE